jgi:NADH-quinone oxidoreductase subunit D
MLKPEPHQRDDRRCMLPEKQLVYNEIESLINHFKLVMDGPQVPAGEIYVSHEAPNGELGFYLSATAAAALQGARAFAELFVHMGGMHTLLEGYQLATSCPPSAP